MKKQDLKEIKVFRNNFKFLNVILCLRGGQSIQKQDKNNFVKIIVILSIVVCQKRFLKRNLA